MFDDLAHILRLLLRRDQQRVWSFDNHQIIHADRRNELAWSVNVIAAGVQYECSGSCYQISILRIALRVVMFVQRCP